MKSIRIQLDEEERLETVIVDGQTVFNQKMCLNNHAAVLEVQLNNYSGEGFLRVTETLSTSHSGF